MYLPFARQAPHANAVHGHNVHEENHPLPKDWIAALLAAASEAGGCLDWANRGLCVDERGAAETIDGIRRGTPADLVDFMKRSTNTLVIPAH